MGKLETKIHRVVKLSSERGEVVAAAEEALHSHGDFGAAYGCGSTRQSACRRGAVRFSGSRARLGFLLSCMDC